jgi:diadenylate cyclase
MQRILTLLSTYFDWFYIAIPDVTDIIEILILAFLIYKIMLWFKSSRAWTLLKGIIMLLIFMALAAIFQFNTILYLLKNAFSLGILAIVVLFQPELRRGLDELGRKNIVNLFAGHDNEDDGILSEKSIYEIIKTATELSAARTGALIVIENQVALGEYIDTGICVDGVITNQLLLNIFEHNTPLHDGAVIIRKNRVLAATCYLPLSSDANISKELGTRHRAGIGISEISDSVTLIVSEETGSISIASGGELYRNLDAEGVRRHLQKLRNDSVSRKIEIESESSKHSSKKKKTKSKKRRKAQKEV